MKSWKVIPATANKFLVIRYIHVLANILILLYKLDLVLNYMDVKYSIFKSLNKSEHIFLSSL